MHFELSVMINRPPPDVFAFLRDKDQYPQESDSPVLALDKVTDGPPNLGARYCEVVQMFPFVRGAIFSEITRFEPYRFLEERFKGAGMKGYLAYEFIPRWNGTELIQRESLQPLGLLRLFGPLMKRMLSRRLLQRLESIKQVLESGWEVNHNRRE